LNANSQTSCAMETALFTVVFRMSANFRVYEIHRYLKASRVILQRVLEA